jgi:hypothetical protein
LFNLTVFVNSVELEVMDSKENKDEKLAMNGSSPDLGFSSPKRRLIEAKERDAYFDKEVCLL